MPEQGKLRTLLGVEYWTCKIHPRYIHQARSQGLVVVDSIECPNQQHVWNVSFPCGTKHVIGTFESSQGLFQMHIFRTPDGDYWGLRVSIPGYTIRTMEPMETRYQQEATRLVEHVHIVPIES